MNRLQTPTGQHICDEKLMEIRIKRPDDWHLHLRDGAPMRSVLGHTAQRFGRAIIMPNLQPPVTTVAQALAYRDRIMSALPDGSNFQPLMTIYLTDNTSVETIREAARSEHVYAAKLYPAGATTNSDAGVTDIDRIRSVLETMAETGVPLLVHGEVTDSHIDVFDREKAFIEQRWAPMLDQLPGLKVVFEHITTADAVQFVTERWPKVGATITPHHLLYNRNAIFVGGLRPHMYCLPVLKREVHRQALVGAATGGHPAFFLGTDSAPHSRHRKETACGCAGIYSAHAAVELYAEVFEQAGALGKLEGFASRFGAEFYGLEPHGDEIILRKDPWTVPEKYAFGDDDLIPLRAGEPISWRLV